MDSARKRGVRNCKRINKWASCTGLQPVQSLTHHTSLEEWAYEALNTPTGPTGRQARWHLPLGHVKVEVGYVPGPDNEIPDIMTRWAYPACESEGDVSMHGTPEDDKNAGKY